MVQSGLLHTADKKYLWKCAPRRFIWAFGPCLELLDVQGISAHSRSAEDAVPLGDIQSLQYSQLCESGHKHSGVRFYGQGSCAKSERSDFTTRGSNHSSERGRELAPDAVCVEVPVLVEGGK